MIIWSKIGLTTLLMLSFTSSISIAEPQPHPQPLSLSRRGEFESNRTEAEKLSQQALEKYKANQLSQAIKLWEQALKIYLQLDNKQATATTLRNLIAVNRKTKDYEQSITYLQQYLTLTREIKDKSGEISALTNLAKVYTKSGKLTQAALSYEQALILVREAGDRKEEANILGNLAIAYKTLGNYVKAIETNQKSLKIIRELGNLENESKVLKNLGNVYEALGDYDNAIAFYQRSLTIASQINNQSVIALALNNLGQIDSNQGKYDKAINTLEESLSISRAIKDIPIQTSTLINLGSTYHSQGNLQEATANYQESLQLAQSSGNKQRELEALGSLGLVHEDLKKYPQAIDYFQKSLTIAKEIGDPEAQGMGLNNLGHVFLAAGKLEEAEKALREAVKLLDEMRPGLSDAHKIFIFDTKYYTYNLLQQILVAANKPEAALEAAEQGKARAFVDLLATRTAKKPDVKSINSQPFSLKTNISIEKIQAIAKAQKATIVEYTIVPEDDFKHRGKLRTFAGEMFIWVVKPTGEVIFKRIDLKEHTKSFTLKEIITSTRQTLGIYDKSRATIGITRPAESKRKQNQHLEKLHNILIKPIAKHLPKNPKEKVIFVPQTELFLIPFPALKDADNKYLIQKHTILTAPSIQSLEFTRKQKQLTVKDNFKSAVVVGNPIMPTIKNQDIKLSSLPYAEKEANDIAEKLLGSQKLALIASKATEKEVIKRIPDASLIHLATHGLLHETRLIAPGPPGAIALASSPEHDGFLTAGEIINMKLKAQLAVLSACDTGRGDITGDGVVGLSRSFIAAGVPSVIVSLWQVNDKSTSELMTEFYQQLLADKKRDKAKALRKAMLETMKKYPEPRFWAAFSLIGES